MIAEDATGYARSSHRWIPAPRMTPFGERIRALRRERGVTQGEMAKALGISSAYLSALEHGRRGRPTWQMLQRIIGYLNVIWDDAEELERLSALSHPKVSVETAGLSPQATQLANRLAECIATLSQEDIAGLLDQLEAAAARAEIVQRAKRRR
jgi:transcriptional regulator with XRE-family HTH domain